MLRPRQNDWTFYLIAIIVGIGISCLTTIPIATALTSWFEDRKGFALGIAMAGAGTGSFVWMQVVSMLNHLTYQTTYALLGGIILIVCLPLSLLVMALPPDATIESKKKEKLSFNDIHSSTQLILFSLAFSSRE